MARYALVIDGVVTEERNYDSPPASKVRDGKPLLRPIVEKKADYNPDNQTYTVSREVQNNKVVDTWVVRDLPEEDRNARLLAALADHRYEVETGGVTLNGLTIQTDRDTRANLIAARIKAKEDPDYSVVWKTDTAFVTLDAAAILQAADAVADHVQRCYETEANVSAVIDDYTSAQAVVEAFNQAMKG